MTTPFPDRERTFLGICLLDLSALDRTKIRPEHLVRDRHAVLLRHMLDLRRAGRLESPDELAYSIVSSRQLEEDVGGLGYATGHADSAPTVEVLPYVERLILEDYHRRQIRGAAARAQGRIQEGDSARSVDAQLRADLDGVRDVGEDLCEPASSIGEAVWKRQDERLRSGRTAYIRSGWRSWDDAEDGQGWSSEGVTMIVARSGMGKTSFVNSTAVLMAASGTRVVVHGTETSRQARVDAMAYGVSGIDPRRYHWLTRLRGEGRARPQDEEELEELARLHHQALAWLGTLPLRVSGAGLTVEAMAAEVSRLHHADLCDVLLVDYLQDFVVSVGVKVGERVVQVGHASATLKALSSRLGIPILVAAQMSDEKETARSGPPPDPFPEMHQIQWSSGAHQDAEEIYALNRGEYWRDRLGQAYRPDRHGHPGVLEVQSRKRRSGRLVRWELTWDGPTRWVGPRPQIGRPTAPPPRPETHEGEEAGAW